MAYGESRYFGQQVVLDTAKLVEFLRERQPLHPVVYNFDNSRWRPNDETEISLYSVEKKNLQALYDLANDGSKRAASNTRRIKGYMNLLDSYKTKVPKNLPDLTTVIRQFTIERCEDFAYTDISGTRFYRASHLAYNQGDVQEGRQAYVSFTLSYCSGEKGERRSKCCTFEFADLSKGMTVEQLLAEENLRPATKEDLENYQNMFSEYVKVFRSMGKQYTYERTLETCLYTDSYKRRYDGDSRATISKGSKVIINTPDDGRIKVGTDDVSYFLDGNKIASERSTYPSFHDCELCVFSLEVKENFYAHIRFLKEYVYDDNLKDKLILPQEQKDCLDILVHYDSAQMADIVDGKSAGTVIIASGDPGCGKTLSCQCLAEASHKPLYSVQAAELGIDPDAIEKNLERVLNRASKWKCVLLLDEADTYIRRRDADLVQSSIVAVFLRVLEYFKGVLFLTTNRFTTEDGKLFVDDAVLSRATAHIRVLRPTKEDLYKIMFVQAKELELELSEEEADKLSAFFSEKNLEPSGRDIRNFFKLSKMFLARDNSSAITLDVIKKVLPFHATISKDCHNG